MKKKTTIFKTLLLAAAMMLGGAGSADAQTTLYYRTLTGTESDPADAVEQAWATTDYDGTTTGSWTGDVSNAKIDDTYGGYGMGLRMASNTTTKTINKTISPSSTAIITYDIVWYTNSRYSGSDYNQLYLTDKICFQVKNKSLSSSYVSINGTNKTFTPTSTEHTEGKYARQDVILDIHVALNTYSGEIKELTIKDVNDSDNTLVELSNLTVTSVPKTTDFTTIKLTTYSHQTNPVNSYLTSIKVQQEDLYAYSINWKSGDDDMGVFTSGYDENGASITIPYYRYLSTNHELYKISTGNATEVQTVSFTKTTDNQTEYMTGYTKQDVGYVVFCEEAENIVGMSASNSQNGANRASGRYIAYCSEDVTITTLPAGTYTITAGLHGNNNNSGSPTFLIKAGDTTILSVSDFASSTRSDRTSEPFTIDETTEIKVNGGTYRCGFDNFYIVSTSGRVATVDNLGYTFSSTLPLDFTDTNVRAYIAKYDDEKDVICLTNVKKVPANTGLFIKGEADDIPVLTGAADAVDWSSNVLKPFSSNGTLDATVTIGETEYTNFVLGLVSETPTFLKVPTTDGVSMTAGKAYLQIPTTDVPAGARMAVVFNDETTGVSEKVKVNSEEFATAQYYNLSGQRVEKPTKGLYIVNGKKVIVK